jgi:ribosomal protein S18 acetylase RimI-like enzyme
MTGLALGRLGPTAEGPRRFDPARDLREVIALLKLGFGADLDERDRRWLEDLDSLTVAGPLVGWVLRLLPAAENVFGGFVWIADGRVVGNASLMRATRQVWVIANVVTHPDYRRRGIARGLVVAAMESARAFGARQVQLQVRDDNQPARDLYRQLGFQRLFDSTLLRAPAAADLRSSGAVPDGWQLAPWRSDARWRVEGLLARAGDIDGPPPGPVRQALAHQGWRGTVGDRLRGQARRVGAAVADEQYVAVAAATAQRLAGAHTLELRVDPRWRGRVEPAMVDWLVAFLARQPAAELEAEVRDDEAGVRAALDAAGFRPVRTLVRLGRSL